MPYFQIKIIIITASYVQHALLSDQKVKMCCVRLLCPWNIRDVPYVNVMDLDGLTFANVTSLFTIQVIGTIVYK
jgi:hypothetical protein